MPPCTCPQPYPDPAVTRCCLCGLALLPPHQRVTGAQALLIAVTIALAMLGSALILLAINLATR